MFDGKYFEWNQKRVKGIVDFYGYKFFYFKRILDLGCGYGDLGGVLYRLGSDVTAVDARQEHLKILSKKFSGIKTIQSNLDGTWPFHGQKFDMILDLALMCHLVDYEKHLREVCASTTHLVLETAVCDSDDPHKVIQAPENKGVYDLSFNGMGCRPSPAAIERILRDCGMNFKRLDNAKFNSDEYKYDWYPVNDNSTSLFKRRIWFAVRDNSPIQFANPASEIAMPPISAPAERGYITPVVNSGIPVTSVSPKPPMSARMDAEARARAAAANPQVYSMPLPSPIRTHSKALSLNDRVRDDSRKFALITPDDFQTPSRSDTRAIILPTTYSSRMWFKKIAPLFPHFRLSNKVISMPNYEKSDAVPDLVMCDLDNLQAHNRVYIDEWVGPALQEPHLEILKKCHAIITPSLHNAEEIWKYIPHANVFRINKSWPAIELPPVEGNYYLYFEKSAELTDILLKSWDPQLLGNIVMVGPSIKVPDYVTYVSDAEPYSQIMRYILGAKALIDLSENNYYASGLISLATDLGLPVISNNHAKWSNQYTSIQQDKRVSLMPTTNHIRQAIDKFMAGHPSKPSTGGVRAHNDNFLIDEVRKIVGA